MELRLPCPSHNQPLGSANTPQPRASQATGLFPRRPFWPHCTLGKTQQSLGKFPPSSPLLLTPGVRSWRAGETLRPKAVVFGPWG